MPMLVVLKSIQIFGIVIVISMLVAVIIKLLVMATGRISKSKPAIATTSPLSGAATPPAVQVAEGIPTEVVAVITAALAVVTGPHRVLRIAQSQRSWSAQARISQHAHFSKK